MTKEEIIQLIKDEYRHGIEVFKSGSLVSRFQGAAHAQCASSILDHLEPDLARNREMAKVHKSILDELESMKRESS